MPAEIPLLERGEEESLVAALVRRLHEDGTGRVVLFEGPAGVGKTSVLTAARAAAGGAGCTVLGARGTELEQDYPWGVARQLFETSVRAARAALSPAARAAADLTGGALVPAGPQAGEYALVHSLLWLASDLAAGAPLVLLVDDLHWADVPSLRFLAYLAARIDELPVAVVGAVRPGAERVADVLAAIGGGPRSTVRTLRPFSAAGTGALLAGLLGGHVDDRLATRCHEVTRGNPLLVHELGRHLATEPDPASREAMLDQRPPGVDRYVDSQLRRLPPDARRTVRAVAVLGDRCAPDRIAAVADLPVPRVLAALSDLRDHQLLGTSGTPEVFSVWHPLVRSAIHDGLGPAERADLHLRAARAALRGDDRERAASHLLRVPAGLADFDVAAVLSDAAESSIGRGSVDGAVRYLRRLLDEDLGPTRARILGRLGAAEAQVDLERSQRHLADALALLHDPPARAELSLLLAGTMFLHGRMHEALPALHAELARADALPTGDARAMQALVLLISHLTPGGGDLAALAARYDEQPPDPSPGGRMLSGTLALVHAFRNRREQARERAEHALTDGVLLDTPVAESPLTAAWAAALACDSPAGPASITAAIDRARRSGSLRAVAPGHCYHAAALLHRGELPEAVAEARTSWEACITTGIRIGLVFDSDYYLRALVGQGRLDAAEAVLRHVRAQEVRLPRFVAGDGEMELLLALGRVDEALAVAATVRDECARYGICNPAFSGWQETMARGLHLRGRGEEAAEVAAGALARAREWGTPRVLGRALRIAALTAGAGPRVDLLTESVEVLDGSTATLELARSRYELGDALRRARRIRDARMQVQAALDLAERCGAGPLADDCVRVLRLTGAVPARGGRLGPAALTTGERRVTDLAVAGRSNREIAQQLFITVKTVEVHLSSAFRKLGIRRRQELARALADRS